MISQRLKDLRKGYKLTEEAYELVEWTKDNRCYCSACSMPPCGSCENGLPEDIAYECDEYWEVDPEYEEEVVMSRSEIVNKSTTKDSPKFKVDDRVKIKKDSRFYEGTRNNPKDTLGRIAFFSKGVTLNIRVDWDNGGREDYSENDLELAEPKLDKQEEKVDTITVSGFCSGSPLKDVYDKWAEAQTTRATIVKARPLKDNREFYYDSTSKWVVPKEFDGIDLTKSILPHSIAQHFEQNKQINLNQQEESNMSNANRRVVNVKLLDNDSGLPVENSLVAQFDNIVTEDPNDVVVQEILLNKNIADSIAKHNQKRVELTDLEILKRTGNDVKLRQVKLKDLTWIVTTA